MKTFKRICAIESAVRQAAGKFFDRKIVACDIGTDHGYIAEDLSKQNYVEKVLATDISAKSLKKLENLMKFQPNLKIFAFLGDGLNPIDHADVTVIAGMGGVQIMKILSEQNKTSSGENKCDVFVLQPAQNTVKLRKFLIENKIYVLSDFVVYDEDRFYSIITINVARQGNLKKNIFNLYLGRDNKLDSEDFRMLLKKADEFLKYLDDLPLERIKQDEVLYEKFKLKLEVKKLLDKGEVYVR